MDDEQRRILQMVQEGTITPDEAARLLDALAEEALPAAGDGSPAPAPAPARAPDDVIAPGPAPRFRRYWEVPFAVGLILLGLAGVCVSSVSDVLLLCGWSAFVVAAIIALAGWWTCSAQRTRTSR